MAAAAEVLMKLLMVGDSAVGKTSLLLRFSRGEFRDDQKNTVGVDLQVKHVTASDGRRVKLTIWDTAGQERFRTLTSSYYRGAHGIILVYDITDRDSFENVQEWLKEIELYSTRDDAVKLLVGNKIDLEERRVVTTAEGKTFARLNSMLYMEASAKSSAGVEQAYAEVMDKILESPTLLDDDFRDGGVRVGGGDDDEEQPALCC